MKISYNKSGEKRMKAVMDFEPAHTGKQYSAGGDSTY